MYLRHLNIVDDILLLAPASDAERRWVLKAGFLAFPAHWSLADKMDRPIETIHAPVPGLNDRLGNHIGRFFDADGYKHNNKTPELDYPD